MLLTDIVVLNFFIPPLHKSSNPFPIGRIRLRPKINFQKFCIQVQKIRTENKESKNIIHWRS